MQQNILRKALNELYICHITYIKSFTDYLTLKSKKYRCIAAWNIKLIFMIELADYTLKCNLRLY